MNNKYVDFLIIASETYGEGLTFNEYHGMRTLGASKAAWAARQHGYTVQVIHQQRLHTVEHLINICVPFIGPETIIGVGTTLLIPPASISQRDMSGGQHSINGTNKILRTVEALRLLYDSVLIIGGSEAAALKDLFDADYCINGPAENELPMLLDKIKRKGIQKKPYNWDIKNCQFTWHETDFIQPNEPVPFEMTRGCIFKCKFCSYDQIGKRPGTFEKNLDLVKRQLTHNYEKLGVNYYFFTSDTFNDDDERVNQFCDMLETLPFKIKFTGFFRLDLFHRFQNTARRLYKNGLVGCNFGIETFHPKAAAAIGKSFNGKQAKEFLLKLDKEIFEENVFIATTNIVGLPYEDEQSVYESYLWFKNNPTIHAIWFPLRLVNPQHSIPTLRLSEFDRTFSEYGYTFPDNNEPTKWKSPWMDVGRATKLAAMMHTGIVSDTTYNKWGITGWTCMLYLSITGMTPKQARELTWTKVVEQNYTKIVALRDRYNTDLQKYALSLT